MYKILQKLKSLKTSKNSKIIDETRKGLHEVKHQNFSEMASVPSATSAIWPSNTNASNSFTLMVHTTAHSTDDIILNKDIFSGKFEVGDYISVADPDRPSANLILKVPSLQTVGGRLEISLSKNIAESLSFKSFSSVI